LAGGEKAQRRRSGPRPQKLLPKEDLAPFALIESRAHALVERFTFPFLGGLAHFLPNKKQAGALKVIHMAMDDLEKVANALNRRIVKKAA